MDDYKSQERLNPTSFKNPNEFRTNKMKRDLDHIIELLFNSEKMKDYELMKTLIDDLEPYLKDQDLGIYKIISPYPMMDFLLNATHIPQITKSALKCISYLILIKPDEYQQQLLQIPDFIDFLFQEINDNESNNTYECISIINNMSEAFQSNFESFISSMNFVSLNEFSLKSIENSELSLELMSKIIDLMSANETPKEVMIDILKIFIKISQDNLEEFQYIELEDDIIFPARIPEPPIVHKVLCLFNSMIRLYFPTITTLIDLDLINRIFESITEQSTNLIISAVCFYTITIDEGLKNKEYLELSKTIIRQANITEMIEWVKELCPFEFLCHIGYHLLALLIQYEDIFQTDAIRQVYESSIVASAIKNIEDCSFKRKIKLFEFIIVFIENSDSIIITDKINSQMFFGLFDKLLHEHFEKDDMVHIIDLLLEYLKKFQFTQSSKEEALEILKTYDFIESLKSMILDEEYKYDDILLGKIRAILEILTN